MTSTLKAQVRRPLVLGIDAGATTDALVAGVDSDRIVCSCVPRDGSNNRHDRT
jgi:hypothetical protein